MDLKWSAALARTNPRGLPNKKNYCYRIACYSMLMNLPGFNNWLNQYMPFLCMACDHTDPNTRCIMCSLALFSDEYWSSQPPEPRYLVTCMAYQLDQSINRANEPGVDRFPFPSFDMTFMNARTGVVKSNVNSQQCAAQFFQFLLREVSANQMAQVANNWYYLPAGLIDLFEASIEEKWTCAQGHVNTSKLSPQTAFFDVAITTDIGGSSNLHQPLNFYLQEHFFKLKQVRSRNDSTCADCRAPSTRDIKCSLHTAPQYIFFQLKAQAYAPSGDIKKLRSDIHVPLALDLSDTAIDAEEIGYKLVSSIYHVGRTPNSGHYISVVTAPDDHCYLVNDTVVSQCTEDQLQSDLVVSSGNRPYLVAYERCEMEEVYLLVARDQPNLPYEYMPSISRLFEDEDRAMDEGTES